MNVIAQKAARPDRIAFRRKGLRCRRRAGSSNPRRGGLRVALATLVLFSAAALATTSLAGEVSKPCRTTHASWATAQRLVNSDGVLVIAHRGDSHAFPENTLPAFAAAVQAGANLVELDYHHTADGVPIVMHDDTLDRTTDATERFEAQHIQVKNEPLQRIRQLDAGAWKGEQFRGVRVPTLDEALTVIQNGSTTLIERKAGDAATCVELLRRRGLVDSVVVQSFDWDFLTECHRLEPRLVLGALGGRELTPEKLDQIAATGAQLVVWYHESLDEKAIQAIHDRGWHAWAFTVDDPQRVEHLIDIGLDGIITNVPAVMVDLVERMHRRVEPSDFSPACHEGNLSPCSPATCSQRRRHCHAFGSPTARCRRHARYRRARSRSGIRRPTVSARCRR